MSSSLSKYIVPSEDHTKNLIHFIIKNTKVSAVNFDRINNNDEFNAIFAPIAGDPDNLNSKYKIPSIKMISDAELGSEERMIWKRNIGS